MPLPLDNAAVRGVPSPTRSHWCHITPFVSDAVEYVGSGDDAGGTSGVGEDIFGRGGPKGSTRSKSRTTKPMNIAPMRPRLNPLASMVLVPGALLGDSIESALLSPCVACINT
ncbi:hypothetical protein MTO96_009412 [Rhipicephalus appendiculatus]